MVKRGENIKKVPKYLELLKYFVSLQRQNVCFDYPVNM